MNKKIFCCIPWTEYCDYPLFRKLIKEKLSKCMAHIRVVVPSFPHGINIPQEEADKFYDWLRDDLSGFATVERLPLEQAPKVTKWSGQASDLTYNHSYVYQFEHCMDQCEYEYIARIETDFNTCDWDKIEKMFDEDFDLITVGIGCTHRPPGDVSFAVFKRDVLLGIEDLTFNMVTQRRIQFSYHNGNNDLFAKGAKDAILFDKTKCLYKSDEQFRYDVFQWAVLRCVEKSDKVYLINPMNVDLEHYVGMTQQYFMFYRFCRKDDNITPQPTDANMHVDESPLTKYIQKMKQQIDINNYNLFPVYKKMIEKYCQVYGK